MDADFESIYKEYYTPVYRYLLSLTKDSHTAEELTQETFFKALKNIEKYDPAQKMLTWLCAIGKNAFFSQQRKAGREIELTDCIADNDDLILDRIIDSETSMEIPFAAQKKAIRRFRKKMTRKNIFIAIFAFLASACVLAGACYGLFVPEFVVPYSDDLLYAHIPIDKGIDVKVNINNYKQVHTWSITDEESGQTDVYLTVTQTLFTRLYTPKDKSDYLWRTNNDSCVDFHSGSFHAYSFGATDEDVQNIYYLEMPPEDILKMTDEISFDNYKTIRIWSK